MPRSASTARSGSGLILLVICVGQFMVIVDETVVNVALPTIGHTLEFSQSGLSWVTNAYLLTFGGFLLVGGRAADFLGRRETFAASLMAFALASLVCGLAPSAEILVIARAAQGMAAALLSPSALSLLLATFRGRRERTRALAVWAALAGLGATTGLLLGGALVELLDWRWIFLVNLPISLLALVGALRVIPPQPAEGRRAAPDVSGAMLVTGALLLLVFTVVGTEEHGWGAPRTIAGLVGVGLLTAAFAARERAVTEPLVPRALLRLRRVVLANILAFVTASGLFAMFFFLTLYMQNVLGYSALRTGLSYLPFSFAVGATTAAVTRWLERHAARPLLVVGPLVAALGLLMLSRLETTATYVPELLGPLLLVGVGLGLVYVPITAVATAGSESRDSGLASGLLTTSQQIGTVLGIAILVTVAGHQSAASAGAGALPAVALVDGFQTAFVVEAAVVACAALLAAAVRLESTTLAGEPVVAGGG